MDMNSHQPKSISFSIFQNSENQSLSDWAIKSALTLSLLLAAIIFVFGTFFWILHDFLPIPFMDEWSTIAHWVDTQENGRSAWLTAHHQHNEHRILIPRLFFFADLEFFNGSGLFTLITLLVIQVAHTGLLSRVAFSALSLDFFGKVSVTSFLFILMFSVAQLNNLIWPFQIQFICVFFFATTSFLFLGAVGNPSPALRNIFSPYYFLLGVIFAALASFSMSNGLLVWVIGLIIGLQSRWAPRRFLLFFLSASLVWVIYGSNLNSTVDFSYLLEILFHRTGKLFRYSAVYLGTPIAPYSTNLAGVIGYIGITITIFTSLLFIFDNKSNRFQSAGSKLFICLALFSLGTALITGLVRLDFGLDQATANRYGTTGILFWIGNIGALISITPRISTSRARLNLIANVLIFICLINLFTYQAKLGDFSRHWISLKQAGASALLANVYDHESLAGIFPDPSLVLGTSIFLKENQLSIYGSQFGSVVGRPLNDFPEIGVSPRCEGYIDKINIITDGETRSVKIAGWAIDRSKKAIPRVVIFANQGSTVGIGFSGVRRPDVADLYPDFLYSGWIGHAKYQKGTELEAYIPAGENKVLCKLIDIHKEIADEESDG